MISIAIDEKWFTFFDENTVLVLLGLVTLNFIVLVWLLILSLKGIRWRKRYYALMGQSSRQGLEERLTEYRQFTEDAIARTKELEKKCANIEQKSPGYLQKVGMIRYNAFPEVGSDLSYSIALLDGYGDGVVISGIYGRNETRTFAKPIKQGQSSYRLTKEEEKSILAAMGSTVPENSF